ncbi:MAG: aldehyde dehydrogenase family protein [Planctomycetota bacterium]|jgi:acyl-CoA reductase-like NAD-dependent aldehyde dehydrogenase
MPQLAMRVPCFVAGRERESSSSVELTEKYKGDPVASVALGDATMMEDAIVACESSRDALRETSAYERASILHALADGVDRESEEYARDLVLDVGKTINEARGEVARAVETLRDAAEECVRFHGEFLDLTGSPRGGGYHAIIKRFPIGVCSFIVPFNFPLNLAIHKLAPAIAVGCPFVLKPDTQACLSVMRLARLMRTTDLILESWSVMCIESDARDMLTRDERIALLSFTGSPAVGWALKAQAGRKRVHLELGGNAPCIVDEGVDIAHVSDRIRVGGYGHAGQSCISTQRVYALPGVYDDLRDALEAKVGALRTGDPMDERTDVGPLFRQADVARVESWVQEATPRGAGVLVGGRADGRFMQPTLLEGVPSDSKISCQEVFGPVVVINKVSSFDEALQLTNDSPFGLQAGVFTNDMAHAFRAFDELEFGSVNINDVPSMRLDTMPYGGIKQSGLGREGAREVMLEMTEPRQMLLAGLLS